jgi:hypothetical protein
MDPTVLEDIKEVEKLHRKLMAAGVGYDVYRKYAECMRCGLASWVQQNSAVYTEDVKAAEAYRDNGTWSSRLNRYKWFVMGDQGSGLFFEDGGPCTGHIDFWLMVDAELRQAVEKEAYLVATMCTANHGIGPEDFGGWKGRHAEAELDEVFGEASRNARELVVKWAEKEYDNAIHTPPAVELGDESVEKLAREMCTVVKKVIKPGRGSKNTHFPDETKASCLRIWEIYKDKWEVKKHAHKHKVSYKDVFKYAEKELEEIGIRSADEFRRALGAASDKKHRESHAMKEKPQ